MPTWSRLAGRDRPDDVRLGRVQASASRRCDGDTELDEGERVGRLGLQPEQPRMSRWYVVATALAATGGQWRRADGLAGTAIVTVTVSSALSRPLESVTLYFTYGVGRARGVVHGSSLPLRRSRAGSR